MKRIAGLILCFCMIFAICSCGSKNNNVSTWQEQYDLGVRYLFEGNYEEAILAFTVAIEIDPKRPEGYSGLAEAYTGAGNIDAARKALEDGFAATGSEEIRSLLEEMEESEIDLPMQDVNDTAASEVSESLELSNITYRYEKGGEMAELNDGAVGGLYLSFTAHGPEGLCDVLIATWFDEMPGTEINGMIAEMVSIWKDGGWANQNLSAIDLPSVFEQGRPVDAEEIGRTQYVLLIGLDEECNALGYAIVPVQIPG